MEPNAPIVIEDLVVDEIEFPVGNPFEVPHGILRNEENSMAEDAGTN